MLHCSDLGRVYIRMNGKLESLVFGLKTKIEMYDKSMNKYDKALDLEMNMLMDIIIECVRNESQSRDALVKVSLGFTSTMGYFLNFGHH